jgi:hypothetical protein
VSHPRFWDSAGASAPGERPTCPAGPPSESVGRGSRRPRLLAGQRVVAGTANETSSLSSRVGHHRWLTVVSPDEPNGTELVLEPDEHPAAQPFKAALVGDGIPLTSFAVDDVKKEFERLSRLGVRFTQDPAQMGPVTTAVFDDTCGNLIQSAQRN